MNPDEDMNSCDVPEENYINDVEYAREPEPLATAPPGLQGQKGKTRGRGRGRGKLVQGRARASALAVRNGRVEKVQDLFQGKHKAEGLTRSQHSGRISRPPSSGGYLKEEQWSPPRGAAAYQQPAAAGGQKRKRGQADSDSDENNSSEEDLGPSQAAPSGKFIGSKRGGFAGQTAKPGAVKIGPGKAKKLHKGFEKLLACGGVWETAKGKGRAVTTAPHWIWEGLSFYDSEAAELAVEAADMASCARYFTTPSQAGSETVTPFDTELASRLTMAGAVLLAHEQTAKASNTGGKPAPVKPPRDKGGTPSQPPAPPPDPPAGELALGGASGASGTSGRVDPQSMVGVGATDHDRLQQIMAMLHRPPNPPPAVSVHASGTPAPAPTPGTAAAATAARASGQSQHSRRAAVQPWQQPPQLTLPAGVSFSDPRNLYNRGQGSLSMPKAAPYQDPPPMYQQQMAPLRQYSAPQRGAQPARSTGQAGEVGDLSRAAGHLAHSPNRHPLSVGMIAATGKPLGQQFAGSQQQQQQGTSSPLQAPIPNGHSLPPHLHYLQAQQQQQMQQIFTANGPSHPPEVTVPSAGFAYPAAKMTSAPTHQARMKLASHPVESSRPLYQVSSTAECPSHSSAGVILGQSRQAAAGAEHPGKLALAEVLQAQPPDGTDSLQALAQGTATGQTRQSP